MLAAASESDVVYTLRQSVRPRAVRFAANTRDVEDLC